QRPAAVAGPAGRAAAAALHAQRRDGGPGVRLPTVHDPADLRLGGGARPALHRGLQRPGRQRLHHLLARGLPAHAAGRDRGLHPGVHPRHRRLRDPRPDGRHARPDDRQPHPEPVRRARQRPARQRHLDGAAGAGVRGGVRLQPLRPAGGRVSLRADRRRVRRGLAGRRAGRCGLWLSPFVVYLFLWVPILVLIVFSFNDASSISVWRGFTTRWYENIFQNTISAGTEAARFQTGLLLRAVRNSLLVAAVSTLIATTLGTMIALAISRGRFPGRRLLDSFLYLPVVIPDITQGVSLAVFFNIVFAAAQELLGVRWTPGFATIVIAHVAFNISYVAIVVRARLAGMDPRLEEAGRDLGANGFQTFWRITFPNLFPGILAGALLAFTLSLDDFVITFFNAG